MRSFYVIYDDAFKHLHVNELISANLSEQQFLCIRERERNGVLYISSGFGMNE